MKTPVNIFKQALQNQQAQIGLWLGLADPYCAEILAGTGYDWLVIDGEHAPNDLRSVLGQLQAIASATSALAGPGSHPVVRVSVGETALIKQYLDLGVQTILVPMVDTAAQAARHPGRQRRPGPPMVDCRGLVRGGGRRDHAAVGGSDSAAGEVQAVGGSRRCEQWLLNIAIKIAATWAYSTRARARYGSLTFSKVCSQGASADRQKAQVFSLTVLDAPSALTRAMSASRAASVAYI
ncbi:HpcH/HpaI aldolase [Rhodoferax ferrireducens T118]|uniref:HpcH/HpaI aldolase n=1 Tax=Albidiferax ferrireducens (strain ATCC BAA-621 / DSM 15236 / T118) TaxID=338969 RepID=Q221Q6_ALBFT|nr:aldolase/citrate lyase family protein [Rhodoferax ferrireducens]ABD68247.1 HpcH/HpaI aldolase [Rhodoferax ferrireducens T118]